jgi:phage antirepressor YoqD-like protein
MNEVTNPGQMGYTLQDISSITSAAYSTVAAYAQKAGWTQNGEKTVLSPTQANLIIEAMKIAQHNQTKDTFQAGLEGIEGQQSRAIRIARQTMLIENAHKVIEAELQAEIDAQKQIIVELKPKAAFFDQVADSRDALQMRDVAAALNLTGWGRNKIFEFLRKEDVLDDRNVPYREFQDRGYFRVIEQKFTDNEGETHISLKTLVYQRGMEYIRKIIQQAEGGAA